MGDEAFLAQIAADPEAAAPYLVYADALQQRGDPRGELIVIQHALERATPAEELELRRREAELFDAHAPEWLGGFRKFRRDVGAAWRHGFCHRIRLPERHGSRRLGHVLEMPHVRSTLAEVLVPANQRDSRPVAEILDRLVGSVVRRVRVLANASIDAARFAALREQLDRHPLRGQLVEATVAEPPRPLDAATVNRMQTLVAELARANRARFARERKVLAAHAELVAMSESVGDDYYRHHAWYVLPAPAKLRECTILVERADQQLKRHVALYELPSLHADAGDVVTAERWAWRALADARWYSDRPRLEQVRTQLRVLRQRRGAG